MVAQAAKSTARRHGSKRSAATPFEDAVKKLILEPVGAAKIAAETIEHYAERHPEARDLVKVELSDGPTKGDPLADLLIRFRFAKGRTVTIATNIKRLAPTTQKPEGGSLLSFVRLATEPNYNPADPPRNHGFDADGAVMEWYAGRRKILDGRDYYILACRVSAGKLHGIEAWGTLAGVAVDGAGDRHLHRKGRIGRWDGRRRRGFRRPGRGAAGVTGSRHWINRGCKQPLRRGPRHLFQQRRARRGARSARRLDLVARSGARRPSRQHPRRK
jgi:hypothetical protein